MAVKDAIIASCDMNVVGTSIMNLHQKRQPSAVIGVTRRVQVLPALIDSRSVTSKRAFAGAPGEAELTNGRLEQAGLQGVLQSLSGGVYMA